MPYEQHGPHATAYFGTYNDGPTTIIINGREQSIDELLPPVNGATYNREGLVAKCYPGTRQDIIARLRSWADDKNGLGICWLSGPAGHGKSAISHAIAEHYDKKGRLCGNFFFFRGQGDRSKIGHLVHTLSNQLYRSVRATRRPIHDAIDTKSQITTAAWTHQFENLIIEPIQAAAGWRRWWMEPYIVIIDALDECDDRDSMKDFIVALICTFQDNRRLPLRVLITSRVEEHIQSVLDTDAARSAVLRLSLTDFDARRDIRSFWQESLSTLHGEKRSTVMRNVSSPWPSDNELDALTKKSDGSFLFATILFSIIGAQHLPHKSLQQALTAVGGLDPLYKQVLMNASQGDNFERVLGTAMLLTEPIPIIALANLLELECEKIVGTLIGLQSVLMIPGTDNEPIRLFHTSLRDFLTSPERSGHFYIHPEVRHLWITVDCLKALTERPKEDIFYSDKVKYACLHWCHHLEEGVMLGGENLPSCLEEVALGDVLEKFASKSRDVWLNTSLYQGKEQLGRLRSVISKLKVIERSKNLGKMLERFESDAKKDMNNFYRFGDIIRDDIDDFRFFGIIIIGRIFRRPFPIDIIRTWRKKQSTPPFQHSS